MPSCRDVVTDEGESMNRIIASSIVALVCCVFAGATAAQTNTIDGVWVGSYTSTYSRTPVSEVLMFRTVGDRVFGAYLSASQATGTLIGNSTGPNAYTFLVTQPQDGCPPATGTLTASVSQGTLQYSFAAIPCKGDADFGKGTAKMADATSLRAFSDASASRGDTAGAQVAGLWNGVYTSTYAKNPAHEKLFFANFGTTTRGIYVSDSGASGMLSGQVTSSHFALSDYDPTPPCPGRAVYDGERRGNVLEYGFHATDCQGNIDIGRGRAEPALP